MSVSRARLLAATFSVGVLLVASSPGYAQDDLKAEGAKACSADANRLCKHVLGQGDMVVRPHQSVASAAWLRTVP